MRPPSGVARAPAGLTAREVEVLRLVACGLPNKEIARRLVISPKTTGNHIAQIEASSLAIRAPIFRKRCKHGLG